MADSGWQGKRRWLDAALERFEAPLLRYAARLTCDAERARDVVQDTFLRLCSQQPEQLDGHLAAWLYRVCRTRALDVLRKERRMQTLNDTASGNAIDEVRDREPSPVATLERRESASVVLELIDSLSPREQEVVRLKFQHGLSYREIAEATGMTVNHVGVAIHSALGKLRERLGESM